MLISSTVHHLPHLHHLPNLWVANHHALASQLVVYGASVMLIGGGFIKHLVSGVPVPYTVALLLFGIILGIWVLYDTKFTLAPGMKVGDFRWTDKSLHPDCTYILACNTTAYVANDLFYYGWVRSRAIEPWDAQP